jgi:hypothetical protein
MRGDTHALAKEAREVIRTQVNQICEIAQADILVEVRLHVIDYETQGVSGQAAAVLMGQKWLDAIDGEQSGRESGGESVAKSPAALATHLRFVFERLTDARQLRIDYRTARDELDVSSTDLFIYRLAEKIRLNAKLDEFGGIGDEHTAPPAGGRDTELSVSHCEIGHSTRFVHFDTGGSAAL